MPHIAYLFVYLPPVISYCQTAALVKSAKFICTVTRGGCSHSILEYQLRLRLDTLAKVCVCVLGSQVHCRVHARAYYGLCFHL